MRILGSACRPSSVAAITVFTRRDGGAGGTLATLAVAVDLAPHLALWTGDDSRRSGVDLLFRLRRLHSQGNRVVAMVDERLEDEDMANEAKFKSVPQASESLLPQLLQAAGISCDKCHACDDAAPSRHTPH